MKRKPSFLLLLGFALHFTGVAGQCPSARTVYMRLQEIVKRTNIAAQYDSLIQWKQQWESCRFPKDSVLVEGLFHLALVHQYRGELEQALSVTEDILSSYLKSSGSVRASDIPKAHYRLGSLNSLMGRRDKAFFHLKEAIRLGQTDSQSAMWVAEAYVFLAFSYYFNGDYEKALSSAHSGVPYATTTGSNATMAKLYSEQARANRALGDLGQALKMQLMAIERIRGDPKQQLALAIYYGVLGEIYEASGSGNEAIVNYKKGFELSQKLQYYDTPDFAVRLGMAFYSQKKYRKAIPYFEFAIKEYKKPIGKARAYNNLGAAYWQLGIFDQAFENYQKGIGLLPIGFSATSANINPPAKAIQQIFLKEYLLTLVQDKADTWFDYYKSTGNRVHLENALNTYTVVDSMIDYMRFEHSGNISKLFWRQKTRVIYEQAIAASYDASKNEEAFHFMEKSKAALLNDQLNELGASNILRPVQIAKEQQLRDEITDLQSKLESAGAEEISIRTSLFSAQQQLETFIKSLEKSNPQYYAYKYDNKVPSVDDVRNKILKENQTFLSYFVGDSAVYGLAIGQKKTVLKKLDLQQYNLLTGAFQRLISDRNTQNSNFREYLRVSSALYKLLIAPFEIPEGARLVISPDGSFLPFSALSRSDRQPDFLVNHYAVSYTYSAVVLGKMQRKNTGNWLSPGFFGMAPVQFAPSLDQAPLAGSEQALRNIDRYFFRSRIAMGQEASRSEFVTSSPGYRIVQLFTHASADSSGSIPTLYFADSTLRLNELSLPRKPLTELLILSACQTGVGKNQRGEGVFSLARGFAALGIPSVLTTLWSVENEPVYQITQNLYDQISGDVPLDIALQNAQKQWLQTASAHGQLPYAWAGMVIVGNTEPVGTGVAPRIIYAAAALLLLAIAAVFYRKTR